MAYPLVAFDTDVTARLTGLSMRQLARWDRIGFFSPFYPDRGWRGPGRRIYSDTDIFALRTIAKLRERRLPLEALGVVRDFFASRETAAWSEQVLYVAANKVYLTLAEAEHAAHVAGDTSDPAAIPLAPIVAETEQLIERLRHRSPDQIGQITRNRYIMQGVPIIAGTRIPTATIADLAADGFDTDALIREFPRLTPADIDAALKFENRATERRQPSHLAG